MAVPKIESYRFGIIIIDGRRYTNDVVIYPDHVDDHWWRQEGHSLSVYDLPGILEEPPEVLVIGQGSPGLLRVPPETRRLLEEAGVEVIAEPTSRACETYNHLRERRRVVAALHLTC